MVNRSPYFVLLIISIALSTVSWCSCFSTSAFVSSRRNAREVASSRTVRPRHDLSSTTRLHLFDGIGKFFEEDGPLGKGITVGKAQVALRASDRSSSSIFGLLEKNAKSSGSSPAQLSRLASEVCLALLRKSDDWTAACSEYKWFGEKDAGKAESTFNDWANREASKFEKEYMPGPGSEEKGGGPSLVVVSIVIEIQGDSTKLDGAGYSLAGTKDVLSSIASDVKVDGGTCLNAVEVFWTPGERDEVLSFRDVVLDFPELIDL